MLPFLVYFTQDHFDHIYHNRIILKAQPHAAHESTLLAKRMLASGPSNPPEPETPILLESALKSVSSAER